MNTEILVYLRNPEPDDREEIETSYQRSRDLHKHWASPPPDMDSYLRDPLRYFVCSNETDEILGTYHISGVIRGWFQSGYLGYEVFSPHQGKGYMSHGMQLLLAEAFGTLNLHRLEANIQPDNQASIALVNRAGFVREGFSRNYLRVNGGDWKDHERWAILNPNWRATNAQSTI